MTTFLFILGALLVLALAAAIMRRRKATVPPDTEAAADPGDTGRRVEDAVRSATPYAPLAGGDQRSRDAGLVTDPVEPTPAEQPSAPR